MSLKWNTWQTVAGVACLTIGLLAAWVMFLNSLVSPSSPIQIARIQAGSVEDGWTQVGNGTRLQYVDLADGVRCYRMRYSSELSCLKIQP